MASEELSRGARISLGAALTLAGIACLALGIAGAWNGIVPSDERWLEMPLGLVVASMGGYLVLPDEARLARAVLGALVVTGLALCFDWIAFGPGERSFTASASVSGAGVRSPVNSTLGRVVFGIGALLMDAAAAWYWIFVFRIARRRS